MAPKKKPAARNAFYFFMQEVYKTRKLKSMHEASNIAGQFWGKMDARARAPYESMAVKARSSAEKLTSLGVPIKDQQRWEQELHEKKKRMDQEIENTVRELSLDPQGALTEKTFYLLHINCRVRTMREEVVPAEIALSEFSIREGVTRVYSSFLNLAPIPQGYCQEAMEVSRKTHKIPLPESQDFSKLRPMCDDATECMMNIRKICFGMSLDDYDDGNYRELPPLYCQANEIDIVRECLVMIANNSDTRGTPSVYPLDNLLFYLQKATATLKGETGIPSLSLIRDEFDKDKFMYVPNISCEFHEEEDLAQHCSRSKVRRWAYLISDFICKDLDIDMIPDRHCQPAAKTLGFEISDGFGSSGFSQSSLSSSSSIWDAPKRFDPDRASSSSSSVSTGAISRMPMPRAEHYLDDDEEERSPPDQGLEFVKVKEKEGRSANFSPTRFSTSPPSTNYSAGLPSSHAPPSFSTFPRATSPPSGHGAHNTVALGPQRQGLPGPPVAPVGTHRNPLNVVTQSYPPPYRGPPAFHGHHHGPLRGEFHRAPRPDLSLPPPNLAPPFRSTNPITRPAASNSTIDYHTVVMLDLNDGSQPRYPKNHRARKQSANIPSKYPASNSYFNTNSSCFNSNLSPYSNANSSSYSNANSSSNVNSSAYSNANSSSFPNVNVSTCSNVNRPLYSNVSTCPNVNPPSYSNVSTCPNVNLPSYSNANWGTSAAEEEIDVKPVIVKSEIVDPSYELQQQQQPPLPPQESQLPPPPPPPQEIPLPPPEQLDDSRKRTWQDTQIDVSKIKKEKEDDEYDANIKIKQEPVDSEVSNGNEEAPPMTPLVKIKQEPTSDDEKEEKPFKLIKIDIPGEAKTPTFGRLIRVDIPQ